MAITRITKGVIKPNENYDTHDINSTGIVTTTGLDVNGNADISGSLSVGGVLTYEDVTSIDSVGIITAQKGIHVGAGVSAVGVGTFGSLDIGGDIDVDGHTNLDNVSIAGVTTFSDHIILSGTNPRITFTDTDSNPDFQIYGSGGNLNIWDATNNASRLLINADGHIDVGHLDVLNGLSVGGNATFADDIDVDGHTNLDNVSVTGVSTFSGILDATNTPASIRVAQDIQHKGDADTKITFPAADNISLETGGSERARLTNNNFILKNSTNFGVGGYAGPLLSGYNGAVIQLHQSQSGSSVGAQIRFTINDLGYSNTDGMFLSYWGNKYFYLQQRETGGGYIFQNTDSSGTLSSPLTINSDSNIQIARDLDVDGHTNLDNVSIAGVSTHSEGIFIPDDKSIRIGNTFASPDLLISSSSSSEQVVIDYARSGTGRHLRFRCTDLMFENYNGLTRIARFQGGVGVGHAELYYAGNKKFETTIKGIQVGTGVTVETNGQATFTGIVTASTYYGDGSNLSNITSTTINNNADNRIITGSGTANTLEGESTLTYNGLQLNISNTVPELFLTDTNSNNSYGRVRGNGGNLILSADVNNATGGTRIINFEIGGGEKGRITSDGHVLFGTTTSRNVGGSTTNSKLQIEGTSTNTSSLSLVNNEPSTAAPFVFFGKTRGNSVGESGQIQNGDTLGGLSFIGADGTDTNNRSAEIRAVVNGSPANNTIPTNLVFSTSAQNATQLAERFRIYYTNTGNGGIAKFTSPASGDMLNLQNETASGQGLILGVDTSNDYTYLKNNTSSTYSMVFNVNGSERVRINPSGKLGIGFNFNYTMNTDSTNLVIGDGGGAKGITLWTASGADSQNISFQVNENLSRAEGEISYGPSGCSTVANRNAMMFRVNSAERLRITSGGQTRMNPPADNGSQSLISEKQALIGTKHFYSVFHTFSGGAGSVNSPLAVNSKIPTNTCGTVEIMAGWANGNGLRYQKYSWIASGATAITQRFNDFNSRYGVGVSVSTPTMSISGDYVNWSFAFSDSQGSKMENLKIHFEYFHQFRVDG